MRRPGAFSPANHTAAPGWAIGSSRARELAAARELLRADHATSDHDRVLDVVAQRILVDLFTPGAAAGPDRAGPLPPAGIVVSTRVVGRIAAPSVC